MESARRRLSSISGSSSARRRKVVMSKRRGSKGKVVIRTSQIAGARKSHIFPPATGPTPSTSKAVLKRPPGKSQWYVAETRYGEKTVTNSISAEDAARKHMKRAKINQAYVFRAPHGAVYNAFRWGNVIRNTRNGGGLRELVEIPVSVSAERLFG